MSASVNPMRVIPLGLVAVVATMWIGCHARRRAPAGRDAGADAGREVVEVDPRLRRFLTPLPKIELRDNDRARIEDGTHGSLALSADGRMLVTSQLYRIQLWDVTTGIKQTEIGFEAHKSINCPGLRRVAVSRDAAKVAAFYTHHASMDYVLDVIDAKTGASLFQAVFQQQLELGMRSAYVGWLDLAFSPSGDVLLLWSGPDKKMYAFDLEKKAVLWKRQLLVHPVSVAFRADGTSFLLSHATDSSLVDKNVQKLPQHEGLGATWMDTRTGDDKGRVAIEGPARRIPVAVHPDGKTVAVGAGPNAFVGEPGAGEASLAQLVSKDRMVSSLAFSADGKRLVTTTLAQSGEAEVERWDLASKKRIDHRPLRREPFPPHLAKTPLPIDQTAMSTDGEILAWGHVYFTDVARSASPTPPLHAVERENRDYVYVDHCVPKR